MGDPSAVPADDVESGSADAADPMIASEGRIRRSWKTFTPGKWVVVPIVLAAGIAAAFLLWALGVIK